MFRFITSRKEARKREKLKHDEARAFHADHTDSKNPPSAGSAGASGSGAAPRPDVPVMGEGNDLLHGVRVVPAWFPSGSCPVCKGSWNVLCSTVLQPMPISDLLDFSCLNLSRVMAAIRLY